MTINGTLTPTARRVTIPTWVCKVVMAITGLIMAAFVFIHMVGNVKILTDPAQMDHYAQWLRTIGEPALPYGSVLWILRVILLSCVLLHICGALILWRRGALTHTPGVRRLKHRGWAAKLMLPTGLILIAFIVIHLLDLTIGTVVESAAFRHPDSRFYAAANVVASMSRPVMFAAYVIALIAIGLHLSHGIERAWQDLGGRSPRIGTVVRIAGYAIALAVVIGDLTVIAASHMGAISVALALPLAAGRTHLRIDEGAPVDAHEPEVEPERMWDEFVSHARLVSPGNRRTFRVVVVGTGLAGASAAAALAELGFGVDAITTLDTPRRSHSVAAQGGINAARARRVDSDSVQRFVTDTIKGGDFRARESEVWRLGIESARVIDHMNALGVPFAREYGGSLSTRSFGGVQVSRTYYSRGQTGQQLQVAASSSLMRQVAAGRVTLWVRHEMLDVVVADGRAAGVITRDMITGRTRFHPAHAVVIATGGYGNVYYYSTLAKNCSTTGIWRAHRAGAALASPSMIQFHPTALPVSFPWQSKTTLMSESLRNDGRIWVPRSPGDDRDPNAIPEEERDYYLERKYPAFGNLTPRDIASRAAREQIESGHGVGPERNSVYLDFRDALERVGRRVIAERYGNLLDMYLDATGEDPYTRPMRIAPGAHFTMGGLWVDFRLMTTIPGLFAAGEANAAYHGANRLGANSLLAACVDGAFTIPRTVPDYLAGILGQELLSVDDSRVIAAREGVESRLQGLLHIDGATPTDSFARKLGDIMYQGCGVVRSKESLEAALSDIDALQQRMGADLRVSGETGHFNTDLVAAARLQDSIQMATLMCVDAWHREESCGAHFRSEYQTEQGEAQRRDDQWMNVSAWTTDGWHDLRTDGAAPLAITCTHHAEELTFTTVPLATRNYQ